jgi:hypothetical protein
MARKSKQPEETTDWRAGLEEAKRKAEGRERQAQGRSPADEVHDAGGARNEQERGPQPEPGPEDAGEKLKALQREPEGSDAKESERTRVDTSTGETLLPESVVEHQRQSNTAWERARSGGNVERGVSRAEDTGEQLEEAWRGNEAMLGVGRNVAEEPVALVRAADLPGEGVDPARRFADELGPPGEGAPVAAPSGGKKHHTGAPWPAPLDPSASSPSASPEPGPEPDQQWHPPQDITFADHDAAVRGTLGASREEQQAAAEDAAHKAGEPGQENAKVRAEEEPSADDATPKARGSQRNSAGKIKHTYIADKAIEAAFRAFGGDNPDHGTIQQALLHAQRDLRANYRHHKARHAGGK